MTSYVNRFNAASKWLGWQCLEMTGKQGIIQVERKFIEKQMSRNFLFTRVRPQIVLVSFIQKDFIAIPNNVYWSHLPLTWGRNLQINSPT